MANYFQEKLIAAGRLMFEKRLTDMCGGNISIRDGDTVYMSPRFSGQSYHWNLSAEALVVGKWAEDDMTKDAHFSREGWSHLYIYRNFPDVQAVVHAHPFHVMPFAAYGLPIEPVLESTQKFGVIKHCEAAPAHTQDLGHHVVAALQGLEDKMRKQAAAVIIPFHGIILAGQDFDKTLDALERIDENAYCLTVRKSLLG
ncbi:MAG: class II aldolase/adducin family protein [Anaerolineae bacterium]|nr:class II aldolase/adducin family protein [Anaerolineae bacterium]